MIANALDAAFPSHPEKRRTGRLLWRQMSADAHVLTWGVLHGTDAGIDADVQWLGPKAAERLVIRRSSPLG